MFFQSHIIFYKILNTIKQYNFTSNASIFTWTVCYLLIFSQIIAIIDNLTYQNYNIKLILLFKAK